MEGKKYGNEVSIEELKGHYEVNFMSSEMFIELVLAWHKSQQRELLNDFSEHRFNSNNINVTPIDQEDIESFLSSLSKG